MNSGRPRSVAIALICCVASGLLAYTQQSPVPPAAPPTITVNVNRVMVPVVVRDKQGRAVGNLKREDFQIFDNGKPEPITGFMIENRQPQPAKAAGGNGLTAPQSETPAQPTRPRFVVFLFDDMHLETEDLVHVQKAGEKAVAESLGESDYAAVVSISGKTNTGITQDRRQAARSDQGPETERPLPHRQLRLPLHPVLSG